MLGNDAVVWWRRVVGLIGWYIIVIVFIVISTSLISKIVGSLVLMWHAKLVQTLASSSGFSESVETSIHIGTARGSDLCRPTSIHTTSYSDQKR